MNDSVVDRVQSAAIHTTEGSSVTERGLGMDKVLEGLLLLVVEEIEVVRRAQEMRGGFATRQVVPVKTNVSLDVVEDDADSNRSHVDTFMACLTRRRVLFGDADDCEAPSTSRSTCASHRWLSFKSLASVAKIKLSPFRAAVSPSHDFIQGNTSWRHRHEGGHVFVSDCVSMDPAGAASRLNFSGAQQELIWTFKNVDVTHHDDTDVVEKFHKSGRGNGIECSTEIEVEPHPSFHLAWIRDDD